MDDDRYDDRYDNGYDAGYWEANEIASEIAEIVLAAYKEIIQEAFLAIKVYDSMFKYGHKPTVASKELMAKMQKIIS